jgi:hypothetical protein
VGGEVSVLEDLSAAEGAAAASASSSSFSSSASAEDAAADLASSRLPEPSLPAAVLPPFSVLDSIAMAFDTFLVVVGASEELYITFFSYFIPSSIYLVSLEAFVSSAFAAVFADPLEEEVIDGFSSSSSSPS